MATLNFNLDKRYQRKDGRFKILLQVSIHGQQFTTPTGVICLPSEFSKTGGKNGVAWIQGGTKKNFYNNILRNLMDRALNATQIPCPPSLPKAEIKRRFIATLSGEPSEEPMLLDTIREFANLKTGRTRELYEQTILKLQKYMRHDTPLSAVNKAWLETFQAKELKYTATNSVAIHLRNIRAAFNFAIDNDKTTFYPFRRFKIRQEETQHRALSVQQLQKLASHACEPYQIIYRDFFLLSFYLIGINPVDLLRLTASNVKKGRIEYRRSKTHKPYSVKIEPEALALLERYRGKTHLLLPLDSNTNYHNWLRRCDEALKKIGGVKIVGRKGKKQLSPIEPELTMYWARHTWATLAAQIDIPKETIAAALGHQIGNKITSVYIDFNQGKVDEANRKVIDLITQETG